MAEGIDLGQLRRLVEDAVRGLATCGHRELNEFLPRLGLSDGQPGTRAERVDNALSALQDGDLLDVVRRVLATNPPSLHLKTRFAIEDVLWSLDDAVEITMRVRRELARGIKEARVTLVHSGERFMDVLDTLWVLDDDPLGVGGFFGDDFSGSLRGKIMQHYLRNDDLTTEELFDALGAFKAGNRRFTLFLERLVSPTAMPDEPAQRAVVEAANPYLRRAGAELVEVGDDDGYPVFAVLPTGTARNRRPKTVIFASKGKKPDIRLRSVMDHDIEIIDGAEHVLVYDRPLTTDGIRWSDLQAWWKDTQGLTDDEEAKKSLYNRLLNCLPKNSEPQRNLYKSYHQLYEARVYELPALLPEVWLLWDPKNRSQRTLDAMLGMRMDFLLLLPNSQRIVLEVDGAHHYSSDGTASPGKYADTVRADRELKLAGHEVFRFGAVELMDERRAHAVLQPFFADLFRRYSVRVPG